MKALPCKHCRKPAVWNGEILISARYQPSMYKCSDCNTYSKITPQEWGGLPIYNIEPLREKNVSGKAQVHKSIVDAVLDSRNNNKTDTGTTPEGE